MSDRADNETIRRPLPKAEIRKTRRAWWLWLVPLGALALCAWFVYRDYIATGPVIRIYFQDASGLEENNTQIRYLGATVGQVKRLALTKDGNRVEVKARLAGSATQLARQGTVFWIVRPELKIGAISGLRTIVSGEYIAARPGNGGRTNVFTGAEGEPIPEEPGALHVTLLVPSLRSVQEQSGVYYRGMEISAESARTLLSGGIEFATPTGSRHRRRRVSPLRPARRRVEKLDAAHSPQAARASAGWRAAGGVEFQVNVFKTEARNPNPESFPPRAIA